MCGVRSFEFVRWFDGSFVLSLRRFCGISGVRVALRLGSFQLSCLFDLLLSVVPVYSL